METPRDILLGRNKEGQTTFINWEPRDINSLANGPSGNMDVYKKVTKVVRTIHFEDYERDKGYLFPNYLTDKSYSHMFFEEDGPDELIGLKGLWFGMYEESNRYSQNWYGNINFIINLNTFLNKWKQYKVYFMEVTEYRSSNMSRLLLTSDDYSDVMTGYDPYIWGGPWYRRQDGTNFFLSNARRYDKSSNTHGHNIELFFNLTRDETDLLMAMSTTEAANHEHANSFSNRGCKKYRSGLQRDKWETCPSPWSVQETQQKLLNYDIALSL